MVYFTCNKTNGCNLTFMGFNINMQTHRNLHTQEYEHSATISSTSVFSSKMIGKNKFENQELIKSLKYSFRRLLKLKSLLLQLKRYPLHLQW